MADPRLDMSRPYGTIYPPLEDGSRFEQDGCVFGHDGRFIKGPARASGAAKSAPKPPVEQIEPQPDEAVDLVAWAKGRNYPFFKVKEAMKQAMPNADVSNAKTILAALIDGAIVGADEVGR
jgi:hypothetical protein